MSAKGNPQKFGEFYSDIRNNFSTNIWEYEKFKKCKDNRAKVEYLMGHAIVQKSLATLGLFHLIHTWEFDFQMEIWF